MAEDRITIVDYCRYYKAEPEFFDALESFGIMEFPIDADTKIIMHEQLPDLERYRILYYELEVNPAGIDIIGNLLRRQAALMDELVSIRNQLNFHRSS